MLIDDIISMLCCIIMPLKGIATISFHILGLLQQFKDKAGVRQQLISFASNKNLMVNFYKISPGLEGKLVQRRMQLMIYILLAILPVAIISTIRSGEDVVVGISAIAVAYISAGAIFYLAISAGTRINQNLLWSLDDNGVSRILNTDSNATKLNLLQQWMYDKMRETYSTSRSIPWDSITSIEVKNKYLVIKSKGYNAMSGTGIIMIPVEVENYDEMEATVREKAKL